MEKLPKIGLPLIILFSLVLLVGGRLFYNINAGEAGVIFKTFDGGVETENPPLGEGFQLVWPWNKVVIYEVRQQEVFEKMNVLSSNGLEIKLTMRIWVNYIKKKVLIIKVEFYYQQLDQPLEV